MIPAPRNILCSYHYFREYDLDKLANLRIIGDSGAYSARSQGAEITVPELARWCKQWRHRLCWMASLDVIGDPIGTRKNWHEMVDGHGIPAVPTIHFGAEPRLMDYYAERGVDLLGLGGMVGRPMTKQQRWLVGVFRYAREHWPDMRFHGWGITHPSLLRLPFYSVDSSGWTAGVRYGRVTIRDPRSEATYPIKLDGKATYDPTVAKILRDHYGFNPSQVSTSSGANRLLMVKLSALSASVAEQRARQLHRRSGITAPVWGRLSDKAGGESPSMHLALAGRLKPKDDADQAVNELIDAENERGRLSDPADVGRGPHSHLVLASVGTPGHLEDDALIQLAGGEAPHIHLATMQINNAHPKLLANLAASGGESAADPQE